MTETDLDQFKDDGGEVEFTSDNLLDGYWVSTLHGFTAIGDDMEFAIANVRHKVFEARQEYHARLLKEIDD